MHNNEKILLKYAKEYHPKLYYYLKYGKNKHLLHRKLKKFREFLLKLKELQMKIKYKKYGVTDDDFITLFQNYEEIMSYYEK
jgi:hypothetical protein